MPSEPEKVECQEGKEEVNVGENPWKEPINDQAGSPSSY